MGEVSVKVASPFNAAGYTLEANGEDTVSTIKQYLLSLGLLDQPVSAFSLKYKGETISNEIPLAELDSSNSAELEIDMHLEKLTFNDVNFQLEQLRELLGLAGSDSLYVNGATTRLHEIKRGSKKGKKLTEDEIVELAELPDFSLGDASTADPAVNLGGKGSSASTAIAGDSAVAYPNPLIPKPSAVELKLSHWQPLCRSSQVKLKGILAFIYLVSNDGKEWHFVATQDGFAYVPGLDNSSLVLPPSSVRYTPALTQAIEQISPSTINHARKNGEKIRANPLACIPVPQVSSVAPWLVGDVANISSLRVSSYEKPADASNRDWNEDYQSTRELAPESFSERIVRDRSLCHTATEFATAATEGAVKIVEGAITALNPYEESESGKLYLSKGIFYTHGSDFSQAYAGITSSQGARKAVKKGINGIEQLMLLSIPELCPVLTAVVDYCGRRLVAQAPVPGIFREVPLIVYGQSEDPEVVHYSEEIDPSMEQFAKHLHLKKHPVSPDNVQLQTSAEVHGAKSTDGRFYAIDLHRMQVPDLLFDSENELELLRFEAIVDFYHQNPDAENLNPDIWMSADRFPKDYASSQLQKDIETAKAVAAHVREKLIPSLVDGITDGSGIDPLDGVQLTALMHRKGINMRHLGRVYSRAKAANLENMSAISFEEALSRSLKVQLRQILEETDSISDVPGIVESFVAGFRESHNTDIIAGVENRLRNYFGFTEFPENWQRIFLPRRSLLRSLSLKCGLQWNQQLKLVAINPVVRYSFPRSLTAADAIEAGRISLEAAVSSSSGEEANESGGEANDKDSEKTTESDTVVPEKETSTDKDSDEQQDEKNGSSSEEVVNGPSKELLDQTLTVVAQAAGIYTQIYGTAHSEVAHVLNQVATLFYEYGNDTAKAIEYVRKAITIAERVKGIDSYEVLVMYNNLAYYERSAGNWGTTLEISKHIISTIDDVAWHGFSDSATIFATIAVMLLQTHKKKLQKASLVWFARAIELAKQTPSGPSGLLWFQYAQAQIFQEDYKSASRSMEASYNVFKTKNGVDDASTKEVKGYLEQLLKITVSTAQSEANRSHALSSLHDGTQLRNAPKKATKGKLHANSTSNISNSNDKESDGDASKHKKKSSHKKKNNKKKSSK